MSDKPKGKLTLTRKLGQRIRIGPDVVVTVAGISGAPGRVRLEVEAPLDVAVDREEVHLDKLKSRTPEEPTDAPAP